MSTNEQTRKEKTAAVETLHAEIDELSASIAKLTQEITDLTAEIAEIDKAVAEVLGEFFCMVANPVHPKELSMSVLIIYSCRLTSNFCQ